MTSFDYRPIVTLWMLPADLRILIAPQPDRDVVPYQPADVLPYQPAVNYSDIEFNDSWWAHLKEYCVDGRLAIHTILATILTVAATTFYLFIAAIISVVHAIILMLPAIEGILCALILGMLLFRIKGKRDDLLVLKGCAKGPTPGSHAVRLCNGRHGI